VVSIWSDEKIEELRVRWDAGESCSEIAAAMRMTRNAVIGKSHRLGLSERRSQKSPQELELARRRTAERNADNKRVAREQIRERKMQETIVAMPVYAGSLNIPFADLRDFSSCEVNQCRFIADEPPAPDYIACGNDTLPGESYCPHCRIITRSNSKLSQPERAAIIHMGRRNHFLALRHVAQT
jgi:GcrA cell cycle regulator